jgi:hypothetical protein
MAGNYPGKFGTRHSPATLDISQIIRKVEWATGPNVLMLHFDVNTSLHAPHAIPVEPFAVAAVSSVFDDPIHIHDTHVPIPTVVNPMSSSMTAHTLVWNRAPRKPAAGVDLVYNWKAALFLNLGKIRLLDSVTDLEHYDVVIRFPASEKKTESGVILNAFTTFGVVDDWSAAKASSPHPFSDVTFFLGGPHTIVGNILTFGNQADRATFLSLNGDWFTHDEPATGETFDLLDWDLKAYSFKKRKDFKLKDDLSPDPAILDATFINFREERAHATFAVQIPAYTVTLTINLKTLTMTSKKV